MKDKVKQLAEQAGFVFWSNEEWKPEDQVIDWSSVYDKELEKFLELAVRECADLCDRFQARDVGMQPAECAGAIRKMFGVE